MVSSQIDPNIGDLVQLEHPKMTVEWGCRHEQKWKAVITVNALAKYTPSDVRMFTILFGHFQSSTAETPAQTFTLSTSNDAVPRKEVLFGLEKYNLKFNPTFFENTKKFLFP